MKPTPVVPGVQTPRGLRRETGGQSFRAFPRTIVAGLVCAVVTFLVLPLAPIVPGDEFQVNTFTAGDQGGPAIAMDALGDFVVVWTSYEQDGSGGGIFAQRYDAAGTPQGSEFQVNTYTLYNQSGPAVAMDTDGDFVVAWSSYTQDGSDWGIFAQRYDASGTPQGSEFQVNTYTLNYQSGPAVAMDSGGNFVVAWSSPQDGSLLGIFAQRYDASGIPQGVEFQVNTFTTGDQVAPAIAMDALGNFVVVWESDGQDGSGSGIFAQRYDAAGTPQGVEFQVNTFTTGDQIAAAVALDALGNFVAAWTSNGQDGSSWGIFTQRYDASGTPQGSEFQVNTFTTGVQWMPAIARDVDGDFVVVWESYFQDGSGPGIFAQRYDASGTPQGSEFQVNTYTLSYQSGPAVATDPGGDFVAVWMSAGQDGSGYGVFGRGFPPPTPTLTINNVSVSEGNAGTVDAVFTVSLNPTSGSDVTVNFATADDTASDLSDYQSNSGLLTFTAGASSQPITVVVNGDTDVEPNETFFVNLSGASGATIGDSQGVGTITDDDTPNLTINDVTVTEGAAGTVDAVFTVSLNPTSGSDVSVNFATADDTATAGSDYQSNSGQITILAGTSTGQITVLVNGDAVDEPNETFFVDLSGASGATISDGQGLGTITDDDVTPNSAFTGKVKNTAKQPVAGATIGAYQSAVLKFSTTSAADGRYSLAVTAGTYDLVASKPADGYLDTTKTGLTIDANQTLTKIKFKLFRPSFFQGTVTQKGASTPIAGALVEAVKNGVTVVSTTTAADGTYSLQVTKGTYTLRASKAGYKTKNKLNQTIGDGATKTVNIALPLLP